MKLTTNNTALSSSITIADQQHLSFKQIFQRKAQPESLINETYFTVHAAAAFLQPFIPRKNAKAWLIKDAQHTPLIPFLDIDGEILYRWTDLLHVAVNVLGASINTIQSPVPGIIERRGGEERSCHDQRLRGEITLASGIERRRHVTGDRRRSNHGDRRR